MLGKEVVLNYAKFEGQGLSYKAKVSAKLLLVCVNTAVLTPEQIIWLFSSVRLATSAKKTNTNPKKALQFHDKM